jgi:hypothetical protein
MFMTNPQDHENLGSIEERLELDNGQLAVMGIERAMFRARTAYDEADSLLLYDDYSEVVGQAQESFDRLMKDEQLVIDGDDNTIIEYAHYERKNLKREFKEQQSKTD